MPEPLYDFTLDIATLAQRFPLRWGHPNKTAVYDIACPGGQMGEGTLRVRRWATARPTSVRPLARAAVTPVQDRFTYDDPLSVSPSVSPSVSKVWYPNFADPDLFGYWDGPLLAQDELQVAEHPVLACLRLWLLAEKHSTATIEGGQPTPITIESAPRRCEIDVSPCDARPRGLYGNLFSRASVPDVVAATRRLQPPTLTHLVAMSALPGGRGRYTTAQIEWILAAATTAFQAVRLSSEGQAVTLHAGFWGCGAFGGNRVLMALLQLLAAGTAGIDQLVFHAFSSSDRHDLTEAQSHLDTLSKRLDDDPSSWVVAVHGLGFSWGVSDGN